MATDDEREPSASDDSLSDRDEAAPRKPASGAKAAPARKTARATPARDEEEDDDLDDDEDDLDDDDDTDDEPPPPRKVSRAPASKKAVAARAAPKKKTVVKVKRVPARPASAFLPFTLVGMLMIGGHVFWDVPFAPLAVLGIAIVIWSYMGIGSSHEPV